MLTSMILTTYRSNPVTSQQPQHRNKKFRNFRPSDSHVGARKWTKPLKAAQQHVHIARAGPDVHSPSLQPGVPWPLREVGGGAGRRRIGRLICRRPSLVPLCFLPFFQPSHPSFPPSPASQTAGHGLGGWKKEKKKGRRVGCLACFVPPFPGNQKNPGHPSARAALEITFFLSQTAVAHPGRAVEFFAPSPHLYL